MSSRIGSCEFLTGAILALLASIVLAQYIDRESCPISIATSEGIEGPFKAPTDMVWYGSNALAVLLNKDGRWTGMGSDRNYGNKTWWWSESFDLETETYPKLTIRANRLDTDAPGVRISRATNAIIKDVPVILSGLSFPSDGCWSVVGQYKGQSLSFVTLVEDRPSKENGGN